jgi:hypothetical protein
MALIVTTLLLLADSAIAGKKDEFPIQLTEISGRDGKSLMKATGNWFGRLGTFHDVDGDGKREFVALDRKRGRVTLRLMQIDDSGAAFDAPAGKGYGAGLAVVNLDNDEAMEFIVAHGDKMSAFENALVGGLNNLLATFVGIPILTAGHTTIVLAPVLRPDQNIDLYNIIAFDDDGTRLWHRDLQAEKASGDAWKETRFQWIVQERDGSGATIIITDDDRHAMIGLSGEDGSARWTRKLEGDMRSSRRAFSALIDGDDLFPVLFSADDMLILEPESGDPVFDGQVDRGAWGLPSWRVFGEGEGKGYLVFGENRKELRMVSLKTGVVLWSTAISEKVLEIVPLTDGDRFVIVSGDGIQLMNTAGDVIARYRSPDKIKSKFPPVYRDLNSDGEIEVVFVSGKRLLCWQPANDKLLWETSMFGLVGGGNPVQLFDALYDIDDDGWLDVPAAKGGGTGRWLSGKDGAILTEVSNGAAPPIIDDWDGDGLTEIFWVKTWYELPGPE